MKSVTLALGAALLAPATVHAQQAPAPDAAAQPRAERSGGSNAADPDTVVVTANRAPVAIDRVAASITVLDKAAIDRAGDLNVADLLVRTPGVSLSRNGGYGTTTSLRIRGAESDQTVVVVDGVKLNDPASPGGGYDFGNLLVGDASRIEVLRGPQSILWGSQAIGGVVNVVTPLPDKALEGSTDVEAGSRDTVSGRAAVGGRTGPLAWRIGAQAFTTDGISAFAPGTERDGFTQQSAAARAVLDVTGGVSLDLRGYYSNGRVEVDGFAGDDYEYQTTEQYVGYAGANVALFGGRLRNRLGYAYTDIARDNYDPTLTDRTFTSSGRTYRIEYQGSLAVTDGVDAVFGYDHEVSRFRSASPAYSFGAAPDGGRASLDGVYGQVNATVIDGLTLTGGVRHDDHSRFGTATLFSGGGVYTAPWGTVIRGSYSEGFKAPTLYQLFSEYGNQGLDPEQAKGWEAGAEQRFLGGRLALGATYFERRSRDLITFASCSATSTNRLCFAPGSTTVRRFGYYLNVARAFANGIEASGRLALGQRLSIDGNYSWTVSEDRSPGSANFGKQLARRPRHAWNAGASYSFPAGPSFGAAVRHSGETFDDAANATRLKPYTLVDFRAELPVSEKVALFGRVENAFDQDYQTVYRYGTLGRSFYAGLRGRF